MSTKQEHPLVRKARLAVDKVNSLSYTLHCVKQQLADAKDELGLALDKMAASGEPDEPWARHWRDNLVREIAMQHETD